ncbi:YheC/YheD family protein [Virgibacillus ainsalahensis]
MQVGYYRHKKDNPNTRKLNAIACKFFGIELVFFGPEDIDMESDTINGLVLRKNKWLRMKTGIPPVINNTPYRHRNRDILDYLEEKSLLTFHLFGGKEKVMNLLKKDGSFDHLLIPSYTIQRFMHIIDYMNTHKKIILKPANGEKGNGVYAIEKVGSTFLMEYRDSNKKMAMNEFEEFYNNQIINKKYIMQKYINSKTRTGHPYDIRIQFEKNGEGEWEKIQSYARIGINQRVVSNIASGGGIVRAGSFFRAEFGDAGQNYINKLNEILRGFPDKISELYDFEISTLAIDLGLDSDGQFYMFEINSFPGGTFARGEIAMVRAAYYDYLLTTRFNE